MMSEYMTAEEYEKYWETHAKNPTGGMVGTPGTDRRVVASLRDREKLETEVRALKDAAASEAEMRNILYRQIANLKEPMRFQAACASMQGQRANICVDYNQPTPAEVAALAVNDSDALLAELAKEASDGD
jgi:plasmid stability protein